MKLPIKSVIFLFLMGSITLVLLKTFTQKNTKENKYYTQGKSNRTVAEWEPALGTMITWPLCVPYKLAIELAKDNHLYTLIDNDSVKEEAIKWYTEWGIDLDRVSFVVAPQGIDAWWTRDWGPSAIFTPEGNMYLGDGKYIYATPSSGLACDDSLTFLYKNADNSIFKTETDDNATGPIGKKLNIPVLDLPFINTGGNVLTDGLGTAFSSCILLAENRFFKVSDPQFFKLNDSLLGMKNYHILSNFEEFGIQHLDCFMKLLDEERILVAEPPKDHELYSVYENIVEKELKSLKTVYGKPYEIIRIKIGRYEDEKLAAYTNSIIVNKNIFVPLFQIKEDSLAIQSWQQAMPGYTVKGFTYALKDEPIVSPTIKSKYTAYGWNYGDALHCRTRAVWDKEMLYLTVNRPSSDAAPEEPFTIHTTILDYSKKGLKLNAQKLYWRQQGEQKWQEIPLKKDFHNTHFKASIPAKSANKIEYYLSASSNFGKTETMPRTAPIGFYTNYSQK